MTLPLRSLDPPLALAHCPRKMTRACQQQKMLSDGCLSLQLVGMADLVSGTWCDKIEPLKTCSHNIEPETLSSFSKSSSIPRLLLISMSSSSKIFNSGFSSESSSSFCWHGCFLPLPLPLPFPFPLPLPRPRPRPIPRPLFISFAFFSIVLESIISPGLDSRAAARRQLCTCHRVVQLYMQMTYITHVCKRHA